MQISNFEFQISNLKFQMARGGGDLGFHKERLDGY